jgi:hypothetical protein
MHHFIYQMLLLQQHPGLHLHPNRGRKKVHMSGLRHSPFLNTAVLGTVNVNFNVRA